MRAPHTQSEQDFLQRCLLIKTDGSGEDVMSGGGTGKHTWSAAKHAGTTQNFEVVRMSEEGSEGGRITGAVSEKKGKG